MELIVNGETRVLGESLSIEELLLLHDLKPQMVVVERNRAIVPRDQFATTMLEPGDEIEIVQMMAGG
jgi:thiamine biosynthesis protein ThiS